MELLLDNALLTSLKGSQVDINIHVTTTMNITPFVARQKVNVALLDRVGTGLLAGEPVLMAAESQLRWRVPVNLALPGRGRLDQVGTVDVNVQTGEVLLDQTLADEIARHASQLAASSTLLAKPQRSLPTHQFPDDPGISWLFHERGQLGSLAWYAAVWYTSAKHIQAGTVRLFCYLFS